MRILIARAGALGDTLMATPVVRALGERHPDASIDVLCSESAAPLLEFHPRVDRVVPLRLRNLPYWISLEKRRLVASLRERRYDVAVLLERAARYREILDRAAVGEIRSFRERPFDPGAHAIENNLRAAGIDDGVDATLDMDLFCSESDERRATQLLDGLAQPLVGLHIGYGPRGKKKNQSQRLKGWSLDNFIALARQLSGDGISLVVTGSAEDRADVRQLVSEVRALDISGQTSVRELAAVICKLDLFVSVDSGPAHMAAAVGTPLVVLWGPAIVEQVRPMSSRSPVTLLRHPVPCAPCYETPLMKTCRQNVCMEAITPAEVAAAVRRVLS